MTVGNGLNTSTESLTVRTSLGVPASTNYAGDPNGNVAGVLGDFVTDSTDSSALYYCTTAGNAASAVWSAVGGGGSGPIVAGSGVDSAQGGTGDASGDYSFAFGSGPTSALALNSFAFGHNCVTSDTFSRSFAFGENSTAANELAWAVGSNCMASGIASIAWGVDSTASGNFSYVNGNNSCSVTGVSSWGMGLGITVTGDYSFAFGNSCSVVGNYGLAFGNGAVAATNSLAFGFTAQANASTSIAIGTAAQTANTGSCVISDSLGDGSIQDTAANQFVLTFTGGYKFYLNSLDIMTIGAGLAVAEGTNAKQGTIELTAGVGVVANTAVTANSRIFYSPQDTDVTGFLNITARTNGAGFTITSSNLADTGVVAYQIFEPAA